MAYVFEWLDLPVMMVVVLGAASLWSGVSAGPGKSSDDGGSSFPVPWRRPLAPARAG